MIIVTGNEERAAINAVKAKQFAAKTGVVPYEEDGEILFVEGAPIMVLKNSPKHFDLGVVNGAGGECYSLITTTRSTSAAVKLRSGIFELPFENITFSFAQTFHKVQGQTLTCGVILDLNRKPAKCGKLELQGIYVGVSRVQSLNDMRILPMAGGSDHLTHFTKKIFPQMKEADVLASEEPLSYSWEVDPLQAKNDKKRGRTLSDPQRGARGRGGRGRRLEPLTKQKSDQLPQRGVARGRGRGRRLEQPKAEEEERGMLEPCVHLAPLHPPIPPSNEGARFRSNTTQWRKGDAVEWIDGATRRFGHVGDIFMIAHSTQGYSNQMLTGLFNGMPQWDVVSGGTEETARDEALVAHAPLQGIQSREAAVENECLDSLEPTHCILGDVIKKVVDHEITTMNLTQTWILGPLRINTDQYEVSVSAETLSADWPKDKKILVALNYNLHWILAICEFSNKTIDVLDSYRSYANVQRGHALARLERMLFRAWGGEYRHALRHCEDQESSNGGRDKGDNACGLYCINNAMDAMKSPRHYTREAIRRMYVIG